MWTATDNPASNGGTDQADQKECTTRHLLDQIRGQVTAAKLQKEKYSQMVTALEEHQRQVEEYDTKITTAGDAFKKGIDAVCAGFDELSKAVEQNKGSYECLVDEDAREEIAKILAQLQGRRETLNKCVWKLKLLVIDKQHELERGKAEVTREDEKLTKLLNTLELKTKELADLTELKEIIGCSDEFSNKCRYAFYLDLHARVNVECPSAEDYVCDLVEQLKKLDDTRKRVRELDTAVRVAQDQHDQVKKLRDDLEGRWRNELCWAVTAGSVAALPRDIATACGEAAPTGTTGSSSGSTTTESSPGSTTGTAEQEGQKPAVGE
jgi:hypothetical protein